MAASRAMIDRLNNAKTTSNLPGADRSSDWINE